MNRFFTFLIFLSAYMMTSGQTPSWAWAKSGGGTAQDDAFKVGTDAAGNVYIAGNYSSSSITWGATTLSGGSIYLCKFDSSGNVLWAKTATGNTTAGVYGLATDASGNTYIGGYFDGSSITFGSYTLHNTATWHSYLVKYDASGNVVWAIDAGGNGNQVQAVAVNPTGGVFICGIYQNTTCTIGSTTLQSDGDNDSYVAEMDANGNGLWATRVAGTSWDDVYGIAADGSGNVYVSGYSGSSSLSFGTTITLPNTAYSIFIAKFNGNGNAVWANNTTGSGYNFISAMAADCSGNSYLTGYVDGTTDFGNSVSLSDGGAQYFLAKYDAAGNAAWAEIVDGATGSMGNDVATDAVGNIYATGYFQGSPVTFGDSTLTSDQPQTAFLAKYDASGNVFFALNPGGDATANVNGEGVAVQTNGNILLSGTFYNGSIAFGTTTLNNNGNWDAFVAKINAQIGNVNTSLPTIAASGPTTFCLGDSLILTASSGGNYFWSDSATTQFITVKKPGSYTVTESNGSGCSGTSLPTVVTVLPSARAGIITGPDSICSGATINLTDSGSGTQIWQWQSSSSASNFTNISNATDSVYSNQVEQTTYFRVYVGTGSCSDTTAIFKLVANPLPAPVVFTNDSLFCSGDSTQICTANTFASYLWSTGSTSSCATATDAGGYWVTVADANHCSAVSGHQQISVYPVPSVSITVQGDTLSSYGQTMHQWLLNNSPINGATDPFFVAREGGSYSVQVTDSNGCTAISNAVVVTGIGELVEEETASLYPNPSSTGSVQLTVSDKLVGRTLEVYDDNGRIVFQSLIRNLKSEISLNIAKGVYCVRISSANACVIRKLIKN